MIQAVLLTISIGCLVFFRFLYQRNCELFLCLLIALNFECFYLVPQLVGNDNYKLLLLPIICALLFERGLKGKLSLGRYGLWLLAFFLITPLAVLVACLAGQDLLLGIKAAKFAPLALVYFLLAGRDPDGKKFVGYLVVMAVIVAGLAVLQQQLHGSVNLFPGLPRELMVERLGRTRITVGQYLIATAGVLAFARWVQTSSILYAGAALFLFLEIAVVQQTRIYILAMLLGMLAVYALAKRLSLLRMVLYGAALVLMVVTWQAIPKDDIAVLRMTSDDLKGKGTSGSYLARVRAYRYYWGEIEEDPLLGKGMRNFNWSGNPELRLQKRFSLHLSDIGITHFVVQSGLVGLIWFVYGLGRFWKETFRRRDALHVTGYFILASITIPTIDMFLRDDTLFLFALFLGLLSNMTAGRELPAPAPAV